MICSRVDMFFSHPLQDVVEGYLQPCRRRTDMFHPDLISSLFGNIEDILHFQESFLKDLTEAVDMKVGNCGSCCRNCG